MLSLSERFISKEATHDQITDAGKDAARILYNGNKDESINALRKRLLTRKVAKAKTFVKPERLPPAEASLAYHSHRVYHQIMKWLGNHSPKAEDWGWKAMNDRLIPKTTDRYPAPDYLLKVIACNCSGDCSSLNCGCRRGGYSCTSLC